MNVSAKNLTHQKGVVLITGLIMVLLITIVALAAIRGSGLQENMATNMRDMNISFQSGESALTICEARLDSNQSSSLPVLNGTNGNFPVNNTPAAAPQYWTETNWTNNVAATVMNLNFVNQQPRCVLEKLNYSSAELSGLDGSSMSDPPISETEFRVTSNAYGYSTETRTVLQSHYVSELE